MKIAILPGSYDPMTVGHVNVIERAARMFDEVVVAVMNNDSKQYMLTVEERRDIAALSCAHIPNARVIADSGMLVDLVDAIGAVAIVKGIRDERDLAYEQNMARWNKEKNPRAETLYLPCDPAFAEVSSTAVRALIEQDKSPVDLVADAALAKLVEWGKARPAKNETSKF